MADPKVFIPGQGIRPDLPLARYLPPLPAGVVSTWLADNLEPGAWVLDPFGASPQLAIEAARAGYRVAVAANNPIARFLLEMQAQPPAREALVAALAELASSRRGDERLEPHILELYATRCPECGASCSAQAFIWARDAEAPQAKLIDCTACGHQGEHPTDEDDQRRAAQYRRGGPHRARALERIAPSDHPDRQHAEEALEAYLPRAVYALFTIINRLDSLNIDEEQRRLLSALILSVCDRANTLWAHPSGRARPKQLSAPPTFREYNVWRALEGAMELWAGEEEILVPVTSWPQAPPETGGISLYEGRLREMVADLGPIRMDAVLTAFPRPNQAYWTLSALWAGWLWGREAIGPFASVLRRRRYDWAWHSEALYASLSRLATHLPDDLPFFGLVSESEAGFNAAVLLAASLAGFDLQGLSMRREEGQTQLNWRKGAGPGQGGEASQVAEAAAKHLLRQRGQPTAFLPLQAAAFSEMARQVQAGEEPDAGDLLSELRSQLEVALTYRQGFLRYGGTESSLETGYWWLSEVGDSRSPLADRVEIALVRYLLRYPGRGLDEIDQALCGVFRGLLTPARSLLLSALDSYGEEQEGRWRLAEAEQPRARRDDLKELRALLRTLGLELGYEVQGRAPIEWHQGGQLRYAFHLIASAVFSDLALDGSRPAERSLIVLPGGRAPLALYKIEHDPRLKLALENGWRLVKFRHLRRLADNKSLTAESFDELLGLDPLTEEQSQPPLL